MYNKDTEPVQDAEVKKDQFDKEASGWNERDGVKKNKLKKIDDLMESTMITGKYRDEFGNVKFVNFKLNETVEGEANGIKLNLDGMGNTYNNKISSSTSAINENAEMRDMMEQISTLEHENIRDKNLWKLL